MRPLALMLLFCGCGRVDFTGVWAGTLAATSNCGNSSGNVRWTIAHRDDTLTITPDGTCGSYTADVDGTFATVRAKTCPSGNSIPGGVLELLTPEKLDVLLQVSSSTCNASLKGVLALE